MAKLNPIAWYRLLHRRFYDGPALFNYPGRKIKGYRSPNVLLSLWLRAFCYAHFTLAGGLLLLLTGVIALIGVTSTLMPVYLFAFALISLYIVNFCIGFLFRPKLKIVRNYPASAPAHTPIRIDYQVENTRRCSAWNIYLDMLPPPRGMTRPAGYPFIRSLEAHEKLRIAGYVEAHERGEYQLAQPRADSSFPFGLWRWGTCGEPNKPIVIYPDYHPLNKVELPVGQKYQTGLMMPIQQGGGSMEFFGCREYRYGDNPRRIHAPSWARLRQPIVKEFREEYMCRIAIILDTYPEPRPIWLQALRRRNNQFEAAISLTAAMVDYMVRMDYRIDFFALGVPPLRGGGGRGQSYLQTVLSLLASIHESTSDFPGLPEELIREIGEISASLIVLLEWNDDRLALVQALRATGMGTRVLLVSDKPVPGVPADLVTVIPTRQIIDGHVRQI